MSEGKAKTECVTHEKSQEVVDHLRSKCISRGLSNLKSFGTVFRQFDKDYSRQIGLSEFQKGFQRYGISITEEEELALFRKFDKDGSGLIDFHEFCQQLVPPLEGKRLEVVNDVFQQLDSNGDGLLQTSDIEELMLSRARAHPKCLRGDWTETEFVERLLAAFENADSQDGVVTLQEFVRYYTAVSWCIQDDVSFETQLRHSWSL